MRTLIFCLVVAMAIVFTAMIVMDTDIDHNGYRELNKATLVR
jgi:hypothetical protein